MIELRGDVAIIGSGFGGSLLALILKRCGRRPILLERGRHPRFALGESSTPLADQALRRMAERYGLPRLTPLASYGAWTRQYSDLMRGPKRGFSYFRHEIGRPFEPRADRATELLVAANPDAERADTHWLRRDVDHFLVRAAADAGIEYLDETEVTSIARERGWQLIGRRGADPVRISADFVVDASGTAGVLSRLLDLPDRTRRMRTHSWTIYGHFRSVRRWKEIYGAAGGDTGAHPFPCDDAALHHFFDGGWMYVLRFDDGVSSAGFCLDPRRHPQPDADEPPQRTWREWLDRFPSIAAQFRAAEPVRPIVRTGRIQRLTGRAAGPDWALLPAAACTIDALHSTGIALTLTSVERLAEILARDISDAAAANARARSLREYDRALRRELRWIDRLVAGCYRASECFPLMTAYAMLYFIAATSCEAAEPDTTSSDAGGVRSVGDCEAGPAAATGFLRAADPGFRRVGAAAYRRVCELMRGASAPSADAIEAFRAGLAADCEALNVAGLFDPARRNLYPYVAGSHPFHIK